MLGIPQLAEQLLAYEEGLSSVYSVSVNVTTFSDQSSNLLLAIASTVILGFGIHGHICVSEFSFLQDIYLRVYIVNYNMKGSGRGRI